jgi:hypothetical protein
VAALEATRQSAGCEGRVVIWLMLFIVLAPFAFAIGWRRGTKAFYRLMERRSRRR